jgi:hypothetical protein
MQLMEKKLKHLDFLQLVITRMNVNSFLVKGWAVTLVAAMFAFAAKDSNSKYVYITIVTTLIFWLLDAYYLSQERQYRAHLGISATYSPTLQQHKVLCLSVAGCNL